MEYRIEGIGNYSLIFIEKEKTGVVLVNVFEYCYRFVAGCWF